MLRGNNMNKILQTIVRIGLLRFSGDWADNPSMSVRTNPVGRLRARAGVIAPGTA